MPLAIKLNDILNDFSLEREIHAATFAWPQIDLSCIHRAKAHLELQIDDLRAYSRTMASHESEAELYEALAFWYVEARCEWAQVNLSANHQLWSTGVADQSLLIRGTVGSDLLTQVSRLLRPEDVDGLENGLMSTLNRILYPA